MPRMTGSDDPCPGRTPALLPVETGPGVLVHPSGDRRLATTHWLLSTLPPERWERAREEWDTATVAMLPLGGLFSAVRLPASVVLSVAGGRDMPSTAVDEFLDEVLEGGPVICDPQSRRYYALVPALTPERYKLAGTDWRRYGIDLLGRDTILGVPHPRTTTFHEDRCVSYWSVPMESAAMLCSPLDVARLISAHAQAVADQQPE